MQSVTTYLKENKIKYYIHSHPPVFTVEEAKKHCSSIPGMHCKNLFLKDKIKNQFYLLSMPGEKKLVINDFAKKIGAKKLSFALPDELKEILGLTPGSVSPFGLINDAGKKTIFMVDKEVWDAEIVSFHPNINTETLELTREEFRRYIISLGSSYTVIEFNF
jgi:Ala-tRNA(Pro) deacylase